MVLLTQSACTPKKTSGSSAATQASPSLSFNADSAYRYVAEQCAFGPRVPGSEAHKQCEEYLVEHFARLGADTVLVQRGTTRLYNGSEMPLANIIASYGIEHQQRILVCAHWDSRPYADEEAHPAHRQQPIVGANDGASGVGVIMELARQLSTQSPNVGVDFILFDLEDWGAPDWEYTTDPDGGWALGSAYWAEHPHSPGYKAQYGILLDMVGAAGALFYREYMSDNAAAWVNDKVWAKAAQLGYSQTFINRMGGAVTDDHLNVMRAGIPCIDIIQFDPSTDTGFFDRWHTTRDDMSAIDPATLHAVGNTVLHLLF